MNIIKKIFTILVCMLITFTIFYCGDNSNIKGMELIEGSDAAMTATLADAIKNKEWVVVTGWTPHWMFAKYDLKYLKDPKNVFGGKEYISTIVRKGLKNDMPEVYKFLDNFYWTPNDMAKLMVWNREDNANAYENARRWINENESKVKEWLPKNYTNGEGKEVKLLYVEWASEIASTNVVRAVLEEKMGYSVKMIPVSAAAMWTGIAENDSDAMVAAWLDSTHGHYLKEVKDKVENLGPNLEGTRLGLVVPAYVTINSIEELKKNAAKFKGKLIGIDPGAGLMKMAEECIKEYNLAE